MAHEYYQDAIAKGIALCPDTYNAMIQSINFLREGWLQRWAFLEVHVLFNFLLV